MRAANELELSNLPNPPCPKCKVIPPQQRDFDWSEGVAPSIGGSGAVRAADTAAEMIMEDHKLTDLRGPTETRQGEVSIPKLAPHLQYIADNMFTGRVPNAALLGGGRTTADGQKNVRPLKIAGMDVGSPAFHKAVLQGEFASGGAAEASAVIAKNRTRPQDIAKIVNEK
ncbi:MAG: hypothetical protein KGL39_29440 [Patescibacteria group bacterium]|nr:hypothetical protein [Patescibacteria group bacterium]